MTTDQINRLFELMIFTKGIHKLLELNKTQISNYRRRFNELSLGTKLELLIKLNVLVISFKSTEELAKIFDYEKVCSDIQLENFKNLKSHD